jgi:hypothetical protein
VPASPSFGLPSLSRNSRIVRRSPFSVAFKKDDGDSDEQRKDKFRKEVQDGLERIADHVENIDRTSGHAPSELDLDQQVSCISVSREMHEKGAPDDSCLPSHTCCIPSFAVSKASEPAWRLNLASSACKPVQIRFLTPRNM